MNDSRSYFVEDPQTGRIRFTRRGIERLGPRFARAGVNIHKIRTLTEARTALDLMLRHEFEILAQQMKGENSALDDAMSGLPGWE